MFAHLESFLTASQPVVSVDASWCPSAQSKTALVVDLPGAEGVFLGLALAGLGYRPVPLYNAVPLPCGGPRLNPVTGRSVAAVDVLPIVDAMRSGTLHLATLQIPADAPPAFLLDADRHGVGRVIGADDFDNRSVCFTTDFPSANFLLAQGIEKVLLAMKQKREPWTDLAHVLRRWQDGGISLERVQTDVPALPEHFEVARPSWFGAMFQRALAATRLRRATGGGFGAWMHDSSSGG